MQNIIINNINISPSVVIPSIPPWLFPKPYVDLILKDKMQTNEIFLTKNSCEAASKSGIQIFTDGSKNPSSSLHYPF